MENIFNFFRKNLLIIFALLSLFGSLVVIYFLLTSAATPTVTTTALPPRTVSPFGLQSHFMWGYDNVTIDREVAKAKEAGAKWMRFDLGWIQVEPVKGQYSSSVLARFDYAVNALKANGIEPVVVTGWVPAWANGGQAKTVAPLNDQDWQNFMQFMAARNKNVSYWELWNEPNEVNGTGLTPPDAARFTRLVQSGYRGVKAGNPAAYVISGGVLHSDVPFIRAMYANGLKGYFDYFGLHPYTEERSPLLDVDPSQNKWNFDGIPDVKAILDANGDGAKPIFVTEFGWTTSAGYHEGISEAQQGLFIKQAYERMYRDFPYIHAMILYQLKNKGTNPNSADPEENFGIIRMDFTEKLSFNDYKTAALNWNNLTTTTTSAAITTTTSPSTTTTTIPPVTTTTIVDMTKPTVRITGITEGAIVSSKTLKITVTSADNVGIASVQLYSNGNLVKTETMSTFNYTLKPRVGANTLKALAIDRSGNTAEALVNFTKR